MIFSTLVAPAAALLALFGTSASASPARLDLEKRAGPSGSVITPAGNTHIYATQGYPTGKIHFQYKTVYNVKQNDCGYYGCTAETWYVDVSLKGASGTYKLAEALAPPQQGKNIDAWLVAPANACGKFQLVVREYQNLYWDQINFQSAAPTIYIDCSPLP